MHKEFRPTGDFTVQKFINHTQIVDLVQQRVWIALAGNEITPVAIPNTETPPAESLNLITSELTMQTLNQQMELVTQIMRTQ